MACHQPIEIAFVVLPDVNMMALTSAIEPMRVSNMLSGAELYRWRLYSLDGRSVRASNNIVLEVDGSIRDCRRFEIVFVCASWHPDAYDDPKFFAWLREADRKGKRIGAIDTGSIVLARAQLLEGYRATANYDVIDGFSESHPGVLVTDHLFEIDRNRISCSAGTAPLDMMLNLVAERFGPEFTARVASHSFHDKIRDPAESQVQAVRHHGTKITKQVRDAIAVMDRHIESCLSVKEVAKRADLSLGQMERLFRKFFDTTPAEFYMRLRLERGRQFLVYTSMSVLDVAVACGFASQEHFARRFKRAYGHSPRDERALRTRQSLSDMSPIQVVRS